MLISRTQQEALQVGQLTLLHMHLQWDNFNDISKNLKEADKELHEIICSVSSILFYKCFCSPKPFRNGTYLMISDMKNFSFLQQNLGKQLREMPFIFSPKSLGHIWSCVPEFHSLHTELQQIINFLANEKDHNCSPKQIFNCKMRLAWQFRWIFSLPHAFSFHEKPSHSASRDSQLLPYCPQNY